MRANCPPASHLKSPSQHLEVGRIGRKKKAFSAKETNTRRLKKIATIGPGKWKVARPKEQR